MKPKLRDYLIILFALLTIFVCGTGVGFLLGEKNAQKKMASSVVIPPAATNTAWEERTSKRLAELLNLTGDQRLKVGTEVTAISEKIRSTREDAVKNHYQALLELHDRLLPHLTPDQQAIIKKDRESLQRAIDLRF